MRKIHLEKIEGIKRNYSAGDIDSFSGPINSIEAGFPLDFYATAYQEIVPVIMEAELDKAHMRNPVKMLDTLEKLAGIYLRAKLRGAEISSHYLEHISQEVFNNFYLAVQEVVDQQMSAEQDDSEKRKKPLDFENILTGLHTRKLITDQDLHYAMQRIKGE